MEENRAQLAFELQPSEPHALRYFVPHSGAATAVSLAETCIERCVHDSSAFRLLYIFGPRGAGKSHLIHGYRTKAVESGVPANAVSAIDIPRGEGSEAEVERWAGGFVAEYDRLKAGGGLLLLAADRAPAELTQNPHVQSRMLAGQIAEVSYPKEEELRPVISSLLERRNLRLSDYTLSYLLKRTPRDPLSFDEIFARISELSFSTAGSTGARTGFRVARHVLEESRENKSKRL